MWNKPCAECYHCIPIGDGDGLCDYPWKIKDKRIVDLFDIEPNCPYGEKTKKEVIQLIQSRCIHRRIGILTEEGHSFLYCQDCVKKFPDKEI